MEWVRDLWSQIKSIVLDSTAENPTGISDDVLLELLAIIVGTLIAFGIGYLSQLANSRKDIRRFLVRDLLDTYRNFRSFADAEPRNRPKERERFRVIILERLDDAQERGLFTSRMEIRSAEFRTSLDIYMRDYGHHQRIHRAHEKYWEGLTDSFVKLLTTIDPKQKKSLEVLRNELRKLRGTEDDGDDD